MEDIDNGFGTTTTRRRFVHTAVPVTTQGTKDARLVVSAIKSPKNSNYHNVF
jgi:hypothetical protein